VWLLGTVGDAGRCSAIAVPRWACRQPAMRNGNATGGNTGELALIPSMILSGLVLGRYWKVANVVGSCCGRPISFLAASSGVLM
jgi:hypothetical protein